PNGKGRVGAREPDEEIGCEALARVGRVVIDELVAADARLARELAFGDREEQRAKLEVAFPLGDLELCRKVQRPRIALVPNGPGTRVDHEAKSNLGRHARKVAQRRGSASAERDRPNGLAEDGEEGAEESEQQGVLGGDARARAGLKEQI